MNFKKMFALLMVVVLLAAVCVGCGSKPAESVAESVVSEAEAPVETPVVAEVIPLGTSALTLNPTVAYVKGELSAEDTDEAQVAYYYSEESSVDFDVYQWAKADGETLADVAAAEAAEYDAEVQETEINGIPVFFYNATEESEGAEYETVSYMMEDGDCFVEVVLWLDGDNAAAEAEAIINTLAKTEQEAAEGIALGTSALTLNPTVAYVKGELSAEDTDEAQVAYYYSEESSVDFDVYQWAKADGETLADVAAAEAAEYDAEVQETEINGIPVFFYNATEESEGAEYNTVSYMMEDGDCFVEVVLWLDGDNAAAEAEAIINTLAR